MDSRSGVLTPTTCPAPLGVVRSPRDITRSCRKNPASTKELTPQSYEHPPQKPSGAECGGAPTSTRSGSPCGSPSEPRNIEGEACLTSSHGPPRSALSFTGAGSKSFKVYDASGGPTVETVPGNPCGSSVPDNCTEHAGDRLDRNRDNAAIPSLPDLTMRARSGVTSGVHRQGPSLCDSGDLSARTSRPPGTPSNDHVPLAACFISSTANAPPETTLPVCQARPGNILYDVSGGYTPTAGLDRPCDGSALWDGSAHTTRITLPPDFMEFASTPDILPQQVDEYQPAVEASTSPFHQSSLSTPPSQPQSALAATEPTEVKTRSKQLRPMTRG